MNDSTASSPKRASKFATMQERFDQRAIPGPECWEWDGMHNYQGYAKLKVKGKHLWGHRVSWELANGPIPEGMQVDHLCFNKGCVNPGHLRLATPKQNSENLGGARPNSSTGVRGVSYVAEHQHYRARVRHNRKLINLGTFSTLAEAEAAAVKARRELFTHSDMDRITH